MIRSRLSCGFILGTALAFVGCSSIPRGWKEYREAMTCHFDGKQAECDPTYEKAIKKNTKLQGVHASYGTHLLKQGNMTEAQKEFAIEMENHPFSSKAIGLALNKPGRPDSTTGSSETR